MNDERRCRQSRERERAFLECDRARALTLAASLSRIFAVLAFIAIAPTASAIDHANLDSGRPLRIEDAYPIAHRELVFETGFSVVSPRRASARVALEGELKYGALPNFEIGLGSMVSTRARDIDGPFKSGDLRLSALYNFNQETLALPAFALRGRLDLPTGRGSDGVNGEIIGIVTRSIDRLSFHFNGGYQFIGSPAGGERDGRYKLALGASAPIDAPHFSRLTLLGDMYLEESIARGDSPTFGAEVGVRYLLTPQIVLDAGIGRDFAGPADRNDVFGTIGMSIAF